MPTTITLWQSKATSYLNGLQFVSPDNILLQNIVAHCDINDIHSIKYTLQEIVEFYDVDVWDNVRNRIEAQKLLEEVGRN